MASTILRGDPRFRLASRTRNARFPSREADAAGRVAYCQDAEDVARTLQAVIEAGLRPTVRSSGHCYEDFIVNNPHGAILDVSALDGVGTGADGRGPYALGTGTMLGIAYQELFQRGNRVLPGGTCYTVTTGGHLSGGGYGTLVRQYGLTVDWISAVDIVTVDARGHAVPRRVSRGSEPELFRALRGGQGSNFGIITQFHFEELPRMPDELIAGGMNWNWEGMTEDRFVEILRTWGEWAERTCMQPETWGLFGGLTLTNRKEKQIGLWVEYTQPGGGKMDVSVITDLLDRFQKCRPVAEAPKDGEAAEEDGATVCYGEHRLRRTTWLENTLGPGAGSSMILETQRGKYKSSYMKKNFTEEEARLFYRVLNDPATEGISVLVDNYGGKCNDPARVQDTAVAQRSSCMKLQFINLWDKPEDDAARLKGMQDAYRTIYSNAAVDRAHKGTPWHGAQYEGCYINYPDVDMLAYDFWPELYYGPELYPLLQDVKRRYDPHNVFHHAMAIRG